MCIPFQNTFCVALSVCGLLCLLGLVELSACDAPVYRYALERWEGARFPVVLFHGKQVENRHKNWMTLAESANVNLTVVNVTERGNGVNKDALVLFDKYMRQTPMPNIVVYAGEERNRHKKRGEPLLCTSLDSQLGATLLMSSARRQVADYILKGSIGVWVVVESGVREKDHAFHKQLGGLLKKVTESVIAPQISNGRIKSVWGTAEPFPVVVFAKNDRTEQFFLNQLLEGKSPDSIQEPVAFPIFGRGRVLTSLVASELTETLIHRVAEYLTGPCSCEIKAENPGRDLLFAVNWHERVERTIRDKEEDAVIPLPSFIGN